MEDLLVTPRLIEVCNLEYLIGTVLLEIHGRRLPQIKGGLTALPGSSAPTDPSFSAVLEESLLAFAELFKKFQEATIVLIQIS